ncbi:hypothetical protein HMF7854_05280 [Sphingomonas ginkgonis]|uniref:Uncharacterized protein n=1 Tax=Sphingomonas ginkgonis TaxID=2315330 RepID=A0A3R9X6Z4_9SPHN|nr:hypothetical protein [Sphingomonas ginkgonis]RST30300.1 hypothetical protein HMF7854_05280 [Sphingomonas ginkgonis]
MRHPIILLAAAALLPLPALAAPAAKRTVVVKHMVNPDGTVGVGSAAGEDPAVQRLVNDCSGRKFETTGSVGEGADKRETRIKLCGKPGASGAEWAKTLKDARSRIAAADLPDSSKAQIVAALDTAIARAESEPGR